VTEFALPFHWPQNRFSSWTMMLASESKIFTERSTHQQLLFGIEIEVKKVSQE